MPHQASNQNQNPVLAQARRQDAAVNNPSSPAPVPSTPTAPAPDPTLLTIQEALESNTALITSSIEQLREGAQVTKSATDVSSKRLISRIAFEKL